MATQQIPIHQNVKPIATILSDCTNDQIAFSNNTDLTKNVTNGSMVYRVGSYFYVAPISTKIDPNTGVATAQDAKFAYVTITDGTADTHAASVGQVKSLAGSKGSAGAINVANGSTGWTDSGITGITRGIKFGYSAEDAPSIYANGMFGASGKLTLWAGQNDLAIEAGVVSTTNNIVHAPASTDVQSATRGQVLPAYGVKSAIRPASPFTKASRTFTIPSGWVFRLGYDDFTAGQLSVIIPNVAGEYLIYLDTGTKALAYTTGSRPAWGAGILVCRLVYSQVSADEISMIWETHGVRTKYDDDDAESKHKCIGSMAEVSNRPVPADLVYNGSAIGLTNGYMWDEDKRSLVASKVGATANWAKFYYNGLTAESKNKMERFPADMIGASQAQRNQIFVKDSDVGLGATGRAVFNNVTGTPVLQTIAATSAMLIHIFSSDGVIDSSALVLGQKEYTGSNFAQAVQAAREGCVDEIKSIKMSEGSARDAYHVGSVIINATGQIQYVDAANTQLYIPSVQTLAGSSSGGAGTTPTLEQVLQAGNSAATAMVLGNNLTVSGSIVGSGLYQYGPATASTVPVFNANKQFVSSAVTSTELGYLSGVTSAVQTQLNNKAPLSHTTDLTAHVGTSSSGVVAGALPNDSSWYNGHYTSEQGDAVSGFSRILGSRWGSGDHVQFLWNNDSVASGYAPKISVRHNATGNTWSRSGIVVTSDSQYENASSKTSVFSKATGFYTDAHTKPVWIQTNTVYDGSGNEVKGTTGASTVIGSTASSPLVVLYGASATAGSPIGTSTIFSVAPDGVASSQATAAQIEAAGSKAVVNIEYLRGGYTAITGTSGSFSLPNETGTWRVTGTFASAGTGGLTFSNPASTTYVAMSYASASTSGSSVVTGGASTLGRSATPSLGTTQDDKFDITISHIAGTTVWTVNGSVSRFNYDFTSYSGNMVTTANTTTLNFANTSGMNIVVKRVS